MSEITLGVLRTLIRLRWIAIAGQCITVLLVVHALQLPLPEIQLWAAICFLALFNVWAWKAARKEKESTSGQAFFQLGVDIAALTWLIFWSGGAMNPFASLFLLPVALAAVALRLGWAIATAVLCTIGYAVSTWFGALLPHTHGDTVNTMNLHLIGMAINYLISMVVILFFVSSIAAVLRTRERDLAGLRERFARNEGIVALATQAASVAHELNTPLATLTLILGDRLDSDIASASEREDLETMTALVNACRDRVRSLAAPASFSAPESCDLGAALDRIVEYWQLLRPAINLVRSGDLRESRQIVLDPGVGHLLQALLNNAAEASERAGSLRVDLHVDRIEGTLFGHVRDYGAGMDSSSPLLPGTLFRSSKADGLGVGLTLSHATVERLGGDLAMEAAHGGGIVVRFRLPLQLTTESTQ